MKTLIFVDCEANGPCIGKGFLTEFGAVEFKSMETFHGILFGSRPSVNPLLSGELGNKKDEIKVFTDFAEWLGKFDGRPCFVSDNPAFDWQWINYGLHHAIGHNPFGWSARRISDFYAGLVGDWNSTQKWKQLRITEHDHNPVHDALGNVEAFRRLLAGER